MPPEVSHATGLNNYHDRGHVMAYWVQGRREWWKFFRWKKKGILSAIINTAFIKTTDIIITNTGVSLNGKFSAFAGDARKIRQVSIIDEASPKILHISYHHSTSKGVITNNIHVPIPKGRLGEAIKLMQLLEE